MCTVYREFRRSNPLFRKVFLSLLSVIVIFNSSAQISYDAYSIESKTELEKIDHHIESYRIKIEYAKSTPEENAIAVEEGWYEMMRKNLQKYFEKKRIIINQETSKFFVAREELLDMPVEKRAVVESEDIYIIEI